MIISLFTTVRYHQLVLTLPTDQSLTSFSLPAMPCPPHARSVDVLDMTSHPGAATTDPFAVVAEDMAGLNANIKRILGVDHPVLARVAKYFFEFDSGKKVRPAMVLLMGRAVNHHMAAVNQHVQQARDSISSVGSSGNSSRSISRSSSSAGRIAASSMPTAAAASASSSAARSENGVAFSGSGSSHSSAVRRSADWSPTHHDPTVSYGTDGLPAQLARALAERNGRLAAAASRQSTSNSNNSDTSDSNSASSSSALSPYGAYAAPAPLPPAAVFPLQARLAEVTEMIHTASLLHDDVIDTAGA